MRVQLVDKFLEAKHVIKLKGLTLDNCIEILSLFIDANLSVFEIIEPPDNSLSVLKKVIYYFSSEIASKKILVGAGGVFLPQIAIQAVELEASFITLPMFSTTLIEIGQNSKSLVIPGASTPEEFLNSYRKRVEFVQLFPASAFGPGYAKEILNIFPGIMLMASGGIKLKEMARYFKAGVSLVALGDDVITKEQCSDAKYLQRLSKKLSPFFS